MGCLKRTPRLRRRPARGDTREQPPMATPALPFCADMLWTARKCLLRIFMDREGFSWIFMDPAANSLQKKAETSETTAAPAETAFVTSVFIAGFARRLAKRVLHQQPDLVELSP